MITAENNIFCCGRDIRNCPFGFKFKPLATEKQIVNDNYSDNGKNKKRYENTRGKPERDACAVIGMG